MPLLSALVRAQVWYDNRASDLTKEGMLKGIEQAAAFILFLSADVLNRPYCQMEIRHALALKKPMVLLHGELRAQCVHVLVSVAAPSRCRHRHRRRICHSCCLSGA